MKTMTRIEAIEFCIKNNVSTEFFQLRNYNQYIMIHEKEKNIIMDYPNSCLEEIQIAKGINASYKFFFIAEKDVQQKEEKIIIKDKSASRLYLQQQKPIYDMSYSFAETSLKMPSWVRKHLDIWCILMSTKRKGIYLNTSLNPWIPDQYIKYPVQTEDMAQSEPEKFVFVRKEDIQNPFFKIENYPDPYEPDKRNKEVYEYCHIRKGAKVKRLCFEK